MNCLNKSLQNRPKSPPIFCKDVVEKRIAEIMEQREEILEAFIAKYGFEPDRAIQVETHGGCLQSTWHVRRMTDEEMKCRALESASL